MEWFYADADEHVGPFSETQMAGLVRSGAVAHDTLVWKEGMDSWVPAREAFPSRSTPPPIPNRSAGRPTGPDRAPLAPPSFAVPDGPRQPAGSVTEHVGRHWASLDWRQRLVTVLSALAVLVAWRTTGSTLGNVLWLSTLVTFVGATQFSRAPLKARLAALWGAAVTGLLAVWAMTDFGTSLAIAMGTDHLYSSEVETLAFVLFVVSVVTAILVRKKGGPGADSEAELDADSPWASWGVPEASQEGENADPAAPVVQPTSAPVQLEGSTFQLPTSTPVDVTREELHGERSAPTPPASAPPEAVRLLSSEAHDVAGASDGPPLADAPVVAYPTDPLEDEARRRAWATRAGVVVLVALTVWAGLAAYDRSEAERARVSAFVSAVEAVRGPNPDAALAAGAAAAAAKGDESDLVEAFGPQGPTYAGRLAEAYGSYVGVAEGPTAQGVERQRSVLEGLERTQASALSAMEGYERQSFVVGRQFGASSYEAVDDAVFRKVVLLDGDGHIGPDMYARRAVLYVRDEGERAVTVTLSNAYRSYEQTEYYTHFSVKGSADEVDRLVNENAAGLAAARAAQRSLEYEQEQAVASARETYWSRAQPVIAALQAAE